MAGTSIGQIILLVVFIVIALSFAGTVWQSAQDANTSVGGGTAGNLYVLLGGLLFVLVIILAVLKQMKII